VLKPKVFLLPTWCDMCSGILVGNGFECTGPCKLRCHRGLGWNNAENCRADLLLKPCQETQHSKGEYRFGDLTRQIFRNEHQRIKDIVLNEIVKEQRERGKFEKMKEFADELSRRWHDATLKHWLLCGQLISALATLLITYSCVCAVAWPIHGRHVAGNLAWLQAVSNFTGLAAFEGVVLVTVHVLAHKLHLYSQLVHGFVREMVKVDLQELDINLSTAALAVAKVSFRGLQTSGVLLILGFGLWLRAMQNVQS